MTTSSLLTWALAIFTVGILAYALFTIDRAPIPSSLKAGWAGLSFLLPIIGPAIWLWWIKRLYPRRKAEDPDWEPGQRKDKKLNLPRGRGRRPDTSPRVQGSSRPRPK